eukprot:Protomagalhaensia_sp_Gyna_25__4979@NODE_544_length_3160_cov_26_090676_g425_i0_p2_GENE_NODE_544_length_3160_cov_26_090676_g425_i0NODE_544_length_3160_cov_26_090676_g425_i0_p2_ORF_typecomplete_len358_score57_31Gcd10p/PF04189_13/1_6e33ADH_zinc_N/PF00107_26/0_27_NODE_544_length_3160_cov_26_090676_g425_i03541427
MRLHDDNTAQTLAYPDVVAMKQAGVEPLELVAKLAVSSRSFNARSTFSQEKYILRKMKAHLIRIAVLPVDPVSVAAAYTSIKLAGVRPSDVYAMLNEANIAASGRFLVFDHSSGYLTMNVLRRLGGDGLCLFLSEKRGVSHHIADEANLAVTDLEPFHMLPFQLLKSAMAQGFDHPDLTEDCWFQDGAMLEAVIADPSKPACDRERAAQSMQRRNQRRVFRQALWKSLQKAELDGLVAVVDPNKVEASAPHLVASLFSDLYKMALQAVRPGGRLVLYCAQQNPLVDLAAFIKSQRQDWFGLRVEETMVRKICVLPGRSHPQMEGSLRLFEGHMLCATRLTGDPPLSSETHADKSGEP